MIAASKTAAKSVHEVDEDVVPHFLAAASGLLDSIITKEEEEESGMEEGTVVANKAQLEEAMARCLALAAGKHRMRTWSLLTGEPEVTTVQLKSPRAVR